MITYPHRLTIACPESLIDKANQLALLIGESDYDDQTFTHCNYQDAEENLYSVASTAVKAIVMHWLSEGTLPSDNPEFTNPRNADLDMACDAYDAVKMGVIKISTNDDAQAALVEMGLSLIPSDDDV